MTEPIALSPKPLAPAAIGKEHFWENTTWRMGSLLIWVAYVLLNLVGICVYGLITVEQLFSSPSVMNMLESALPLLLLVAPMVMIAASGGLDLSIGSVVGLSSIVMAMMLNEGAGIGASLTVAMLAALAAGAINACLVGLLRIHGALVTLAMAVALRGTSHLITGGQMVYARAGDDLGFLESAHQSILAWIAVVIFLLGCIALVQLTPFGRRHHPARQANEPLRRRFVFVGLPYVLSSLMAGVAGALWLGRLQTASATFGVGLEFRIIFAVVLGGLCIRGGFGSVVGSVLAVMALVIAQMIMLLQGVNSYVILLIRDGGLLLALVLSQLYYAIVAKLYRLKAPVPAAPIPQ